MDDLLKTGTISITPAMLRTIAEIDEFKGAWTALGRLAPERLNNLRRVAAIESIGSSTRIEGAKLSDREVDQLLSKIDVTSFASRDEQEVAGYAAAMETVFAHYDSIGLTENHIKQLHRDLLQYAGKDERHRGAYKTLDNHVEAFGPDGKSLGVIFETATPFETPAQMEALVAWTRNAIEADEMHPLIIIGVFVVVFLAIHPFQDGNGRLSRILTTLLLLRANYAYVPYVSLESVIERSKEDYYRTLRRTQGTLRSDAPDWQPWLDYFLGALRGQKRVLDEKIRREKILLESLPPLSLEILDIARTQGRVTVAEAAQITGTSRNTVKDHLKALTESGHLARHGAGRGTWYALA
ncbi:cell division protein Fic [Iodidimonas muriae]|uniref:Cell division protein Fic n=1 Tax=Iodidimonas muriae TaxID=261467 RepID=A0ABQ2LCH6_9PROT|nr:Fic family protein [Iodidimonas muriae]GER06665.1 cell division protein Fic [Kordiimonadales bacterium JCM 17843]GGO10446.1 cell division protein Fic [Iodidimonas muriae]